MNTTLKEMAKRCDALAGRLDLSRGERGVLKEYPLVKAAIHPRSNPAYTELEKRRPVPIPTTIAAYFDARDHLKYLLKSGLLLPRLRRYLQSLPTAAIEPELPRRTLARLDPASPKARRQACLVQCNLMLPKPLLLYRVCYILNCQPLDLYTVTESPIHTAELITEGY